jgi:hypothetical protein
MGHLWDALEHAYRVLAFAAATGKDAVFRVLVLARVIEPTSKLDSARVLEEVGVEAASYPTLNRRLPRYAVKEFRRRLAAACARQAGVGPARCACTTSPRCTSRPMPVTGSVSRGYPRCGAWSRRSPRVADRRHRVPAASRVAQSLGGVISVAAILGAPRPAGENAWTLPTPARYDSWMVPRMALITYGTQLRAYFSRFFPELYGPAVLGVTVAPRARLLSPDPWDQDWATSADALQPLDLRLGSVRSLLRLRPNAEAGAVRWYSLWRLTDFLGFPLVARPTKNLDDTQDETWAKLNDAYAHEVDFTAYLLTIMAHSDYPRTDGYDAALNSATSALAFSRGTLADRSAPASAEPEQAEGVGGSGETAVQRIGPEGTPEVATTMDLSVPEREGHPS